MFWERTRRQKIAHGIYSRDNICSGARQKDVDEKWEGLTVSDAGLNMKPLGVSHSNPNKLNDMTIQYSDSVLVM